MNVIINILSIVVFTAVFVIIKEKVKKYNSFLILINIITIGYFLYFIIIVYTCFSINKFSESIELIIIVPLLIISIIFSVNLISIFRSLDKSNISPKKKFSILISSFFGYIFSLASIYYILYFLNPTWFIVDSNFDIARLAFEFIYYTFSITITYSSSTIIAIGIVPKIINMIHIIIFYFYIGNIIISFFTKKEN